MPSRYLTHGGAFVLMNLLLATAAFGQVDPTLMFSGVRGGSGPGTASLTGTNPTHFFILTDIQFSAQYSAGDVSEVVLAIDGAITGQRTRMVQLINLPTGTPFQTMPLNSHFGTGIVFPPGDELFVRVENILNFRPWQVIFSGYFVEVNPGAVGQGTPSVAPSHLAQNVPNPFNPTTTIAYTLAAAGNITLRFYDSQGRVVRTLIDGRKEAGQYTVTWDGRNDSGQSLPSGVYYYELGGNAPSKARKAILLK